MSKITSSDALDLITLSKAENKIGDVKTSMLTLAQFSSEHLGTWMLMDGSSCVGTAYEALTGLTTVPDLVTNGAFPRQAKTGRGLGSAESDAIRNITGVFGTEGLSRDMSSTGDTQSGALFIHSRAHGAYGGAGYSGSVRIGFDASKVVPTADENRPKNVALNFFIKVGY